MNTCSFTCGFWDDSFRERVTSPYRPAFVLARLVPNSDLALFT